MNAHYNDPFEGKRVVRFVENGKTVKTLVCDLVKYLDQCTILVEFNRDGKRYLNTACWRNDEWVSRWRDIEQVI